MARKERRKECSVLCFHLFGLVRFCLPWLHIPGTPSPLSIFAFKSDIQWTIATPLPLVTANCYIQWDWRCVVQWQSICYTHRRSHVWSLVSPEDFLKTLKSRRPSCVMPIYESMILKSLLNWQWWFDPLNLLFQRSVPPIISEWIRNSIIHTVIIELNWSESQLELCEHSLTLFPDYSDRICSDAQEGKKGCMFQKWPHKVVTSSTLFFITNDLFPCRTFSFEILNTVKMTNALFESKYCVVKN